MAELTLEERLPVKKAEEAGGIETRGRARPKNYHGISHTPGFVELMMLPLVGGFTSAAIYTYLNDGTIGNGIDSTIRATLALYYAMYGASVFYGLYQNRNADSVPQLEASND